MSAEYLIYLPDGSTEGPYTEEDLLDMVDADELAAGTLCQNIASGRKCRVFDLFRIIRAESLAAAAAAEKAEVEKSAAGASGGVNNEAEADDDDDDEEEEEENGKEEKNVIDGANVAGDRRRSPDPDRLPGRHVRRPGSGDSKAGKWVPAPLKDVAEGELVLPLRTIFAGHPSFLMYWRSLLVSVLLMAGGWYAGRWEEGGWWLAGGWMSGGALLALALLRRSSVEYRVTTRRVEVERGFLSKSSSEIRIPDIRSMNVRKTGPAGILGVGDLIFSSSGGGEDDVIFRQVGGAHRIKNRVRRLQDKGS